MRAYRVQTPGGAEVLTMTTIADPKPKPGWVVIGVKAFGINRSELYTRRGESGDAVRFPRVLGIECVGEVIDAGGTDLAIGDKVAAAMGGMGRTYDGGYAEMTVVPRRQVMRFESDLPWETLGALPETYYTAWTSLFDDLRLEGGQTILIRGGSSSVGMAAASIADHLGCTVIATTRKPDKAERMRNAGVHHVVIDEGQGIRAAVEAVRPAGVDGVLELVGLPATIAECATLIRRGGHLCHTGLLGDRWDTALPSMPDGVGYSFGNSETVETGRWTAVTQTIVDRVAAGAYRANVHEVFPFARLQEAHRCMEDNRATGKLVVRTMPG
ncbi:MAG: zinc-binding dehydrogenase [Myxococcota bacterium]